MWKLHQHMRHSLSPGNAGRTTVGREGKYTSMVGVNFDKDISMPLPEFQWHLQ